MLLNLVDLDVAFLESYDILRMILIVPLFALLLFLMVYQGNNLKITPFPGLFLIFFILVSVFTFIFSNPCRVFFDGEAPFFFSGDFYITCSTVTKKEPSAEYLIIFCLFLF